MKESTISPFVCEWLRRRGLVPLLEVTIPGENMRRSADAIGYDARRSVLVEMKSRLNAAAIAQAIQGTGFSERWIACHACTPAMCEEAKANGIGVLLPAENGSCDIASETVVVTPPVHEWNALLEILGRCASAETAGVKAGERTNSRAAEEQACRDYIAANGPVSWRILYRFTDHSASSWTEYRQRHHKAIGWKPERAHREANY